MHSKVMRHRYICQPRPTYPRYVLIDTSINIEDKKSKWINSTSITHMHQSYTNAISAEKTFDLKLVL